MNPREDLLRRLLEALHDLPDDERLVPMSRAHQRHPSDTTSGDRTALADLFSDRVKHYGGQVYHLIEPDIPNMVCDILATHGVESVVAPQGLPEYWLSRWSSATGHRVIDDSPFLPQEELSGADAVVTTCAAAVADAGIIVLDGSAGQGRRAPTLAPECHVCVVRVEQIGATLPEVIDRLEHRRPITWFGGPAATADPRSEQADVLTAPRKLIVLIIDPAV
ncbi:LUD domain-containing protein [Nocardia sp.]|uniref:LutC/YkgG family protein n=1 Tax=Nocardia sp. TaxID=1821 RepID=UPI00258EABEA|nr:LUD domain-containing protein [Nocardia sp.]